MVKKVGILFGMEDTFPWEFIKKVNESGNGKVIAEPILIDKVQQAIDYGYDVIIDRISQEVPFYRAYLKNAALMGSTVINNPFWWSADEKFFNNSLAVQIGVPVPKTILLPSYERPTDTTETSFRNLKAPLDWEYIFNYIGFPAYLKPHSGGGWKSVYRVENPDDLFKKHGETKQLVMMLQEEIIFEDYYRVYCLGKKYVHIMPYEPRNEHHLRYVTKPKTKGEKHKKLMKIIKDYTLKLNKALGYDFNTVEFAIKNGVPYAIDFCNPAPDADINSVGEENFKWIVEHAAKLAIEKANAHKAKGFNSSWGTFVRETIVEEKRAKKTATKKKIVSKSKEKIADTKVSTAKPKTTTSKTTVKKTVPKKKPVKKTKKKIADTKVSTAKPKTITSKTAVKKTAPKKKAVSKTKKKIVDTKVSAVKSKATDSKTAVKKTVLKKKPVRKTKEKIADTKVSAAKPKTTDSKTTAKKTTIKAKSNTKK